MAGLTRGDGSGLYALAESLAECLCATVAASPGGKTCFCGTVPGAAVVLDYCDGCGADGCGMAWVRLDTAFPSDNFPIPQTQARSCRTAWAARFQVGVARCVPGMDEAGNPPDEVAQSEAVRVQYGDLAAIQTAVDCCLDVEGKDYIVGQYIPLGPDGNCAGGYLNVTVWMTGGAV